MNIRNFNTDIEFNNKSCSVELIIDNELTITEPKFTYTDKQNTDTFFGTAEKAYYTSKNDIYSFGLEISTIHNGYIISANITNTSIVPFRLRSISFNGPVNYKGDAADWMLSGISHAPKRGTLAENFCTDRDGGDGLTRKYEDFITVCNKDGKGMICGACEEPNADIIFECYIKDGVFDLSISSKMTDIIIDPNETRMSQSFIVLYGDYNESLDIIFKNIAKTHNARTSKPALFGWCSWYDKGQKISEDSILKTVTYMEKNKDTIRADVIQIDDGYQKAAGCWEPNDKFPNGFGNIISEINKANAIPGIWLAPLHVNDSIGLYDECKEMFQQDENGEDVRKIVLWNNEYSRPLDPTHPKSKEFIKNIVKQKVEDGFKYIKIDFNDLSLSARYYNPKLTRLQIFRELYKMYREIIGEDIYLMSCTGGISRGTIGYADASRIGDDACPAWPGMEETGALWTATKHNCTMLESLRATGRSTLANNVLFQNDPDVFFLVCPTPENSKPGEDGYINRANEYQLKTYLSFLGLSGGMALTSHPLEDEDYDPYLLEILQFPYDGHAKCFGGGYDVDFTNYGYIWENNGIKNASFQIWNNKSHEEGINIPKKLVDEFVSGFYVYSFWDNKYLGEGISALSDIKLMPDECIVLRFTEKSKEECVIGSNLHISMGAGEIKHIEINEENMRIFLNKSGSRNGSIYIRTPRVPKSCKGYHLDTKIKGICENIYEISVSSGKRDDEEYITIEF